MIAGLDILNDDSRMRTQGNGTPVSVFGPQPRIYTGRDHKDHNRYYDIAVGFKDLKVISH